MHFIPSPFEASKKFPLTELNSLLIQHMRNSAKNIVLRKDPRFVIITGPCSIHNKDSAFIYAKKLKRLQEMYNDSIYIVMRCYVEKARTISGWKGYAYDPYLDDSYDLAHGILESRSLMIELTNLALPIAMEFVDPIMAPYFQDLITWGCIGARTPTSQSHRQLASSHLGPVGFKNTLSGDIECALHGILSSKMPHTYLYHDLTGRTIKKSSPGNPFCHLVLRGSKREPNYDSLTVNQIIKQQREMEIYSPILIDCAHGNSKKQASKQSTVFKNVVEQRLEKGTIILGAMLESFIEEGSQPYLPGKELYPNISITDPCISFEETEELIDWAYNYLKNPSKSNLELNEKRLSPTK